jgi:hypothetical protein
MLLIARYGMLWTSLLAVVGALLLSSNLYARDGQWSRFTLSVPADRTVSIPSPDRTKSIVIDSMELSVLEGRHPIAGAEGIGILLPAEVGWAPDGKAFFITSSDGGRTGIWDVSLFLLEHDRFGYYVVTDEAVDLFLKERPCTLPLVPHVGLLKFTKESSQALLAVEAPLGSSCPDRDTVRGFLIEVPSGTVIREFDQQRLVEEWGETLGARFERLLRSQGP